ncbi:hypothetical protein [Streptomyces sp. NPDC059757]
MTTIDLADLGRSIESSSPATVVPRPTRISFIPAPGRRPGAR